MFADPITQPSITALSILGKDLRADAEEALARLDAARARAHYDYVATLQAINQRWAKERQAIRERVEDRILLSSKKRSELLHELLAAHNEKVEQARAGAKRVYLRALSRLGQDAE